MVVCNFLKVVKGCRGVLHGIEWLGDMKRVATKMSRLGMLGFRPKITRMDTIARAATELLEEVSRKALSVKRVVA